MTTRASGAPLRAWRLILETYDAVVDLLESDLRRERGLPLAWYDVLVQLNEAAERRLAMNELADAVLISRSGLTRLVDGMEGAGLVERQASRRDRRVIHVALTEVGRERLRSGWPVVRRTLETHFVRHLRDADVQALISALTRVVNGVRAARGETSGATAVPASPQHRVRISRRLTAKKRPDESTPRVSAPTARMRK